MTRLQMFRAVHQALVAWPQPLYTGTLRSKEGRHCALGVAVDLGRLDKGTALGSVWEMVRVYLFCRNPRTPSSEIYSQNDFYEGTPQGRYLYMKNWLGNEIAKMEEVQGTPLPVPAWVHGFFERV